MNLRKWISAARLRTLPLAASCVLMGSALGWEYSSNRWGIFIAALLTTFLLQILSNFANDYGDYTHGVDNEKRIGPQRAMQSGAITKSQMTKALIICSVLTLLSGLSLLWIALAQDGLFYLALIFLAIGLAAIIAAFKYTTGKNPYGYRGLGDLFVFLFFGIVGVYGTYFLHTKIWDWQPLLPAATIGFLSSAVLNLNNLRDHENDAAGGKRTLVVLLGFEKGKIYHVVLMATAFASMFTWMVLNGDTQMKRLPIAIFTVLIIHTIKIVRQSNPALLDAELKHIALSTFFLSLLFFLSHIF